MVGRGRGNSSKHIRRNADVQQKRARRSMAGLTGIGAGRAWISRAVGWVCRTRGGIMSGIVG